MNEVLNICVCSNIAGDFKRLIESENISDVKITCIPSKCNNRFFNIDKAADIIQTDIQNYSNSILIGCNQLSSVGAKFNNTNKFENRRVGYCLDTLIDKTLINYFSSQGYYLITNDWLNNYNYIFESWGFNKSTVSEFFKETTKKILLLDTGAGIINYSKVNELSDYINIPVEILPISLDHLRGFLLKIILEWRLKNEKKVTNLSYAKLTRQSADYAMTFDFIVKLVEIDSEEEIILKIFEMIKMLCAPRDIYFIAVNDGIMGEILHEGETRQIFNSAEEFLTNIQIEETESIFLEIVHIQDKIGVLIISTVSFPEYISHYKNLIRSLSFIFGLAIANARKFTLLKNKEETIRKYSEELAMSNKNKDKFFSIIAHDLKSPFHGFLGLTEMFSEDISDLSSAEIASLSSQMHKSAINLYGLLENLLTWARMQKGDVSFSVEELDLCRLVAENIKTIKDRAEQKGITINNSVPEYIKVIADRKMVDSVLRNLISNAIKFTNRNGSVIISAREIKNNMVEISVEDSGTGMTEITMNKLFKLDEKVGKKGTEGEESTGLGLLLCKEFVEKNGGTIWVESSIDIGSTFYFTLPMAGY